MKYLSAAEAGRVIGVTEKTVREWIKAGRLSAHHPNNVPNRLAIPESEVQAIARERQQYTDGSLPSLPELARQIEDLRQQLAERDTRLSDLQEKVERLESRQGLPAPDLSASTLWTDDHYVPAPRSRPAARRQSTSSDNTLPPGAILARRFAEMHGVNPYTFRDHYTKGKNNTICPISSRPKPGRANETEYYVMPEQQTLIIEWWHENDVPFTVPLEEEQTAESGD